MRKLRLSAIHVGQTFLSGIKSLVLLADRNVCPTSIHKNGGDPKLLKETKEEYREYVERWKRINAFLAAEALQTSPKIPEPPRQRKPKKRGRVGATNKETRGRSKKTNS